MERHPGDELQVVHPLEIGAVVAVPVADPALPFQKGQALLGQDGPDHVFADPLGLGLGPGPDPAVDVEAGVTPKENGSGSERSRSADYRSRDSARLRGSASVRRPLE
jgi:hypothetical protein